MGIFYHSGVEYCDLFCFSKGRKRLIVIEEKVKGRGSK